MKIRSPVSSVGGKYFLRQWLNEKLPDHKLYCEVFGGGGHLLFYKKESKVDVLNDINGNLIGFFKTLQDPEKRTRLISLLNSMPYSRRTWRDLSLRWAYGDLPGDEVLRVAEWFYLSRTCFSGDMQAGGFSVPSTTGRNPAKTFRNITDTLDVVSNRLRYVTFENLGFAECIRKYDSCNTLFYCDPPYSGTEDYYGRNCFSKEDHHMLADLLNSAKAKVMVSHYENSLYDELYDGWNRYDYWTYKVSRGLTRTNPSGTRPKAVEVLYCNFG